MCVLRSALLIIVTIILPVATGMCPSPTSSYADTSKSNDWEIREIQELYSWRGNITFTDGEVEIFELVKPLMGSSYKDWYGEDSHVERYRWEGTALKFKYEFLSASPEYDEKRFNADICDYANEAKLDISAHPWSKVIPSDRWVKGFWEHDFNVDGIKEIIVVSGLDPNLSESKPFTVIYLTVLRPIDEKGYDKREIGLDESLGISGYFCELYVRDINSDGLDDIIIHTFSAGASGWSVTAEIFNVLGFSENKEKVSKTEKLVLDRVWDFEAPIGNIIIGKRAVETVQPAGPIIELLDKYVLNKIVNPPFYRDAKKLRKKYKGEPYFIKRYVWKRETPKLKKKFFSASEKYNNATENLPVCDESGKLKIDVSKFEWGKLVPAHRLVKGFIKHDFNGDGSEEVVVVSSHKTPSSKQAEYKPYDFLAAIAKAPKGKYQSYETGLDHPLAFCNLSVMDINQDDGADIILTRKYKLDGKKYGFVAEIYELK